MKFLLAFFLSLNVLALDDFDLAYYGSDAKLEVERTDFIVKLVLHKTQEELNNKYKEVVGEDGVEEEVVAFAQVHELNPVCYIHIVPAKIWDDREKMVVLGHEVYHCALAKHEAIDN